MKDKIWQTIKDEVTLRIEAEPSLKPYLETLVISKKSLISSVAAILSSKESILVIDDERRDDGLLRLGAEVVLWLK